MLLLIFASNSMASDVDEIHVDWCKRSAPWWAKLAVIYDNQLNAYGYTEQQHRKIIDMTERFLDENYQKNREMARRTNISAERAEMMRAADTLLAWEATNLALDNYAAGWTQARYERQLLDACLYPGVKKR